MPTSPHADGVTFTPDTWYAITARDNNPDCPNSGQSFDIPEFYSNDGIQVVVQCGLCSALMEITAATVLDPQPEIT